MSNAKDTKHTKPVAAHKVDKKLFVEKRPEGAYAVRKGNSETASDVLATQAEAIERAKELNPGASPAVERVRNTTGRKPDKWRKAKRHWLIKGVNESGWLRITLADAIPASRLRVV